MSVQYFLLCLIFIPSLIYLSSLCLLFYILGQAVLRSEVLGDLTYLFVVSGDFSVMVAYLVCLVTFDYELICG